MCFEGARHDRGLSKLSGSPRLRDDAARRGSPALRKQNLILIFIKLGLAPGAGVPSGRRPLQPLRAPAPAVGGGKESSCVETVFAAGLGSPRW